MKLFNVIKCSLASIPVGELIRSYIVSIVFLILLIYTGGFFSDNLWVSIYYVLCFIMYPLSVALYRLIFGKRIFITHVILGMILWTFKTVFLFAFAVPLAIVYIIMLLVSNKIREKSGFSK